MTRISPSGGSDHRGPMRHESLMATHHDPDQDNTWMIGYLDIMTLLVALMVLLFSISFMDDGEPRDARALDAEWPMTIPLPSELTWAMAARPLLPSDQLSPGAISAALGVAGLPVRRGLVEPAPKGAPALLALPSARPEPTAPVAFASPPTPLELLSRIPRLAGPPPDALPFPQPVLPRDTEMAAPLADFMLVLTDRPPTGALSVMPQAIAGAMALNRSLSERIEEAPYLPDLEGVEVSRVAEGIKLRVEDQLLFPTAEAELTDEGQSLVQRLVEVIQRHDGEVAVEGHTDSRSIQTPEFPSNWVLSSARAIAIVHALEQAGVSSHRLRAVGLADTQPLAGNDTVEGRAQNRRVEVTIHAR
ncbi:OmpA family protein [Billgrantia endophytica]|uniref:Flagellar motor protein MotB n=1 Tax=Billgrantia endophytica TaxID=2033802 RepID=A0A2N7UB85_9GAMM|nr:OmpA family protein [Halomonas endophytica]PMR77702.1 flagellar motor protein MotB [Halomonas endophytica]